MRVLQPPPFEATAATARVLINALPAYLPSWCTCPRGSNVNRNQVWAMRAMTFPVFVLLPYRIAVLMSCRALTPAGSPSRLAAAAVWPHAAAPPAPLPAPCRGRRTQTPRAGRRLGACAARPVAAGGAAGRNTRGTPRRTPGRTKRTLPGGPRLPNQGKRSRLACAALLRRRSRQTPGGRGAPS